MRTYMTDKQNEEQKSRQRSLHYSLLRNIADIYPTVDTITIRYKQVYRSAFGTSEDEHELKYTSIGIIFLLNVLIGNVRASVMT